jgi:hypothetical protein
MVGDQALKHGDCSFFAAGETKRNLAQQWGYTRKMRDIGEEVADFDVGVFARLEASEELQNKLMAINDRSVGLLCAANPRVQNLG